MTEYASNSHKSREEKAKKPEKFEKVVNGVAKTRKKSEVRKFTDVFLAGDVENVKSYILSDVIIPTLKKSISDIVANGIDILLYGESSRHSSSARTMSDRVSYQKYYRDEPRRGGSVRRPKSGYNYEDVVVNTRGEAEAIINRMDEIIDQYGTVSVADMYDVSGITAEHTDYKYGWTDIRSASAERLRDGGYVIKMPRALPLD